VRSVDVVDVGSSSSGLGLPGRGHEMDRDATSRAGSRCSFLSLRTVTASAVGAGDVGRNQSSSKINSFDT
jgi:hypothetical protein